MYQDLAKKNTVLIILLAAVLLFFAGRFLFASRAREELDSDSISSIKRAIEQTALQCYVIEGAYPDDLDYLIDNYGLRINTDDFVVVYKAVADNRIPDIRVVKREK